MKIFKKSIDLNGATGRAFFIFCSGRPVRTRGLKKISERDGAEWQPCKGSGWQREK